MARSTLGGVALLAAVQAGAQEPAPTALDEVVVTAQRRSESLQSTPISIEAFNADQLEQRGVQGLADIATQVPGLNIEPFPTHNATLRIFIRGVGLADAQLTQDPPVGVYVDGVYVARSVGLALDLAELERIEVLRGPQGTLYGRNTTGGAINLVTRRPLPGSFSMQHRIGAGSRGQAQVRSSLNLGFEELAFRLAALGSRRDGFVDNAGPGGDFGDRDERALRFDARWFTPWGVTADYAYDHNDLSYVNQAFQAVSLPTTNKGQAELFKPYAISQTLYSDQRLESLSSGPPMEESGTRIDGHSLVLTTQRGPYELKYLGGYRKLVDREYADLGGGLGSLTYRLDSHAYDGPAATMANGGPTPLVIPTVTHDQWSHELQLTGDLLDGTLQFVTGLYWFTEDAVEDRHRLNHQLSTFISLSQLDELLASTPLPAPDLDAVLPELLVNSLEEVEAVRLVNFVDLWWSIGNEARAAFGQATWSPEWLDRRLHLTVGYRHSEDERSALKYKVSDSWLELYANGLGVSPPAPLPATSDMFDYVPAHAEYKDDSWSFVAAWDAAEGLNVYAKSVEAYKTGGFNVRDPDISGATADAQYGFGYQEGFAPEHVQSYEIGVKSEWLGRRLRLNADVFRSAFRDMQINFLIPGTISDTKARNAGRARMQGFELDATAALAEGLQLSLDYAYLDAEVLEVRDFDGSNVAHLFPFGYAPRHSGVAAFDWSFLRGDWGQARAWLSYHYISEREGLVVAEERRGLTAIPAYGLVNARLGVQGLRLSEHGSLDIGVWGRNLADEVYPAISIDNVPHANTAVVWGEPRAFGVELSYRYD